MVTETITENIGNFPSAIAITPDSLYAYVVNGWSTYISIIEIATNTATTWPIFDKKPQACSIAITPDGRYSYIGGYDNNKIVVLSIPTNEVVATIPTNQPSGIAASHTYIYVSNYVNSISVIDTATQTVSATIPLPSPYMWPTTIALSEKERRAYVSCSKNVVVIDLDQNSILETIEAKTEFYSCVCPGGLTIVKNTF